MTIPAALVRYGEIGLKGGNRHDFLAALARNLRRALEPHPGATVQPLQGRFLVRFPSATDNVAPGEPTGAIAALARVFGVTSVSPATTVEATPEAIDAAAATAAEAALARFPHPTFRIETHRADKRFPLTSNAVDRRAGAAVLARFPQLKVALDHPSLVIGVEIRDEGVFLFHERVAGPGGLPVGTLGRGLVLLSGGIDSPVAAWLAMKRGLSIAGVFFQSEEFTGAAATAKVRDLARALSRCAPRFVLHVVPFGPIQVAIREAAEPSYRTILYRRAMHRVAVELARRENLHALVSGDNLGQVASQTLENLALTAAASELPLLRPLLTYDKEETVALARRIGTFDISIRPALDCCTVFQPPRPKIRGKAEEVAYSESTLDHAALVRTALAGMRSWIYHHGTSEKAIQIRPVEPPTELSPHPR